MASPRSTITSSTFESALSHLDNIDSSISPKIDTIEEHESIPESEQPEPMSRDDTELRSAIHAIMATEGRASPQTNTLRQDITWSTSAERPQEETRTYEQIKESQRKAQYYNNAFAVREQPNATRDRIVKTSILTAEIKTNVIIRDEYTFLTTLSAFLAARYNRPESSIMITVNHSVCMLFGGSFDPAYLFTIAAISEQIKPTINRRNAALIQKFLDEELLVPADRGVVKFEAVPEENLATSGITLSAEIDQDSKGTSDSAASTSFAKRLSRGNKRISTRPGGKTTILPTPPASPPLEAPAQAVHTRAKQTHSRSVSDATTSSDPEIDVLKTITNNNLHANMSNFSYNSKTTTPKPVGGKKSSFFRKLVA